MVASWAVANIRLEECLVLQLGRRVRRGKPCIILLAGHALMPSYTVLVATLCLAAVAADLVIAVAGSTLQSISCPIGMGLA